jgi:hypothetical protein
MQRIDDLPSHWALQPDDETSVSVKDRVSTDGGYPRHEGLLFVIEVQAESIDTAMEEAGNTR